jgi:hypothetical protein
LLFNCWSSIKASNDGTHAFGGCDGCKTGDSTSNDEYFGWGQFASCGHLSGVETTKILGCGYHCFIACDVSH